MRGRDSYGKERLYTFTEELSQVIMIILKMRMRLWMMVITYLHRGSFETFSWEKKMHYFLHCPNYLPPPPDSGKLYNFFLTSKFKIWIYTVYLQPKTSLKLDFWHFGKIDSLYWPKIHFLKRWHKNWANSGNARKNAFLSLENVP